MTFSTEEEIVIEVGWQITTLIEQIPLYWTKFWQAYQRPVVLFGWILATVVTLKVLFAVLGAINSMPLLAPLLQLVGLACSIWFVFRYLIGFVNRQAILVKFNSLKEYIFGTP